MTDTYSEAWRAECEARYVCSLAAISATKAKAYLELVAQRRGDDASRRLAEGARAMWRQQEKAA